MVPDKFNMVDMEGIDILFSYNNIIPGLYQKLVESIAQCRYQCLYNWYFDGVLIPPTYVEMVVIDNKVWIGEGITVDEEDILEIILNGLKTVDGSIVHITDAFARKTIQVVCYINPVQSGSGDPSPENIRLIYGHIGCDLYDEVVYDAEAIPKASITFPDAIGTVYGATLTVNEDGSGVLALTRKEVDLGDFTWSKVAISGTEYYRFYTPANACPGAEGDDNYRSVGHICEQYKDLGVLSIEDNTFSIYNGDKHINVIDYAKANYTSVEFKNAVDGIKVVYMLANPVIYNLTALQVLTLLQGENYIWHDANGDISVTYWYNNF